LSRRAHQHDRETLDLRTERFRRLVFLRRQAARHQQALRAARSAARALAAQQRSDPPRHHLCRIAPSERVRQPILWPRSDRAAQADGEAAVIRAALPCLVALVAGVAAPAAAQPTSRAGPPESKQGYWWYRAPPPKEDEAAEEALV